MLENITVNGRPLKDIVIERQVEIDLINAKRKRAKHQIKSKHSFYKPSKKGEVIIVKSGGINTEALSKLINLINDSYETGKAFTVKEASNYIGRSQSSTSKMLLFLRANFSVDADRANKRSALMIRPRRPLNQKQVLAFVRKSPSDLYRTRIKPESRSKADRKVEQVAKPHEDFEAATNERDRAILLHANCKLTKVPWHAEELRIQQAFFALALAKEPEKMLEIVTYIAQEIVTS